MAHGACASRAMRVPEFQGEAVSPPSPNSFVDETHGAIAPADEDCWSLTSEAGESRLRLIGQTSGIEAVEKVERLIQRRRETDMGKRTLMFAAASVVLSCLILGLSFNGLAAGQQVGAPQPDGGQFQVVVVP